MNKDPENVNLDIRDTVQGSRPGDRFVRILRYPGFRTASTGHLISEESVGKPSTAIGGLFEALKRLLIGNPIPTSQESHERLNKIKGLAVFASDNISSSAYASEEIMRVLALAGALSLTIPITIAIVVVLAVVVLSYRQTISAYPSGGGSYIVASDNLGILPGLVAAGALLTDYVLTVAVSIAAGVAALTSIFPSLFEIRVFLGVAFIIVLCVGNLRGTRESGTIFAGPTYMYLFSIFGLLVYGLWFFATGALPQYEAPAAWLDMEAAGEPLTLMLILRAFSSGSVALTGVEAVSNGVPAFKPPETRNAQTVLILMGTCFGTIFLGMSFLASNLGILPDRTEQETVVSQLTRTMVGEGTPYHYLVQLSTALILVLAANTAFSGFPLLSNILARDRFLPRQFQFRGDRLDFSTGIILLSLLGSVLVVVFEGSVTNLIPLYTIGVFLAFTLSQTGMVRHWYRLRDSERSWKWHAIISGLGALATGLVMIVVGIAKFALGAWIVMLLIPIQVVILWAIHQHYQRVARATAAKTPVLPELIHPLVIVPIANLGIPARQGIAFARAIAPDNRVIALHVNDNSAALDQLQNEWKEWQPGIQLVLIESPYRMLSEPLVTYVEALRETHPTDTITVVLPELVPSQWWEHLLHNQTALRLKAALLFKPGIVVVSVPYHLVDSGSSRPSAAQER